MRSDILADVLIALGLFCFLTTASQASKCPFTDGILDLTATMPDLPAGYRITGTNISFPPKRCHVRKPDLPALKRTYYFVKGLISLRETPIRGSGPVAPAVSSPQKRLLAELCSLAFPPHPRSVLGPTVDAPWP